LNEEISEITGDALWMTWVKLKSWKELNADGIFIAIWSIANISVVEWLNPKKDYDWCLVVNARQETSIKWLYAAGDVTTNSNKFKQTIMSAAEWCLAANSVHEDNLKI
jgi:thioredoxin reductase